MEPIRIAKNYRSERSNRSNRTRHATQTRNLKNRITCAYTPAERAAIEWLNRTPERPELAGRLKSLRGKPRRQIAKELDAQTLKRLVVVHAQIVTANTQTVAVRTENPGVRGSTPRLPNDFPKNSLTR
jgi:hypothetical protein